MSSRARAISFLTLIIGSAILTHASVGVADHRTDVTALKGRILFTRAGGEFGDETFFLMDADVSEEQQVGVAGEGCCPWATRDGSALIRSTTGPDGRLDPTISAVEGSDARLVPLPDDVQFGSGPLSQDGTRLVLEGFDGAMTDGPT